MTNGFETLADGGARTTFEGGGQREPSDGKGRFDLITPYGLTRLAKHYENGAKKYADRNWQKGMPLSRFIDSSFRHLIQFMMNERSEDHLAAIAWNILGYMHIEEEIRKGTLPDKFKDVPWSPSIPPAQD